MLVLTILARLGGAAFLWYPVPFGSRCEAVLLLRAEQGVPAPFWASGRGAARVFGRSCEKTTFLTLTDCLRRKLRLEWRIIDTRDFGNRRTAEDITGETSGNGGGVVLMHDFEQAEVGADGLSRPGYVIDLPCGNFCVARPDGAHGET